MVDPPVGEHGCRNTGFWPEARGSGIRRFTAALDASDDQVIQIAVPADEETVCNYPWRLWRNLLRASHFTLYDSGLVRAGANGADRGFRPHLRVVNMPAEINDVEAQSVESSIVLLKFWLHITLAEQYGRTHQYPRQGAVGLD